MVRLCWMVGVLTACACVAPPASNTPDDAGTSSDADLEPADADPEQLGCDPTLEAAGKACVPVLEACPGLHVPAPGGGCHKVGVESCDGGLRTPPDWTCQPVGPPRRCSPGWAMTGDGWCEPILADEPCPSGTIEVVGKATCQPIAECGTGTWGNITPRAETLFVNQAYSGANADGSQDKPFTSVADALLALPADRDAHIAVAAGVYPSSSLSIMYRSVVIEGRCPQMVRLESPVFAAQSQVTLRGMTVHSDQTGVSILSGVGLLERVAVTDCGNNGVFASDATVVVRDTLVSGNHRKGVACNHARLTLERSVIRETQQIVDVSSGVGWVGYGLEGSGESTLVVRDSLIASNHVTGVNLLGGSVRIERSVIRNTRPCLVDGRHGNGLYAVGNNATVEVADSVIASNYAAGVMITGGASATLERVIVRDTQRQWPTSGEGIHAAEGASVLLRQSMVARNQGAGVWIRNARAALEGSLIQGTRPSDDGNGGQGIVVERVAEGDSPKLALHRSIVRDNRSAGIWLYGGEATLEASLVQNTLPRELDGYYGFGVLALARLASGSVEPASVALEDCTIAGSSFAGLATYGSKATLTRSVVRETRELRPRRWGGPGVLASFAGDTPSVLELRECLIADNSDFGVLVEGSRAALENSAVADTRVRMGDQGGGIGVYAWPGKNRVATELELSDCRIARSGSAGIQVVSSPLDVRRTLVTDTGGDAVGFGDGVVVLGADARLVLLDSLVQDSQRSGLLAVDATGLADRSLLTRGAFSVVMDAPLELGPRLELQDNTEDPVCFGERMATTPAPALPPPPVPLLQ